MLNTIIADIINTIPHPDIIVSGSEKITIPISVATNGSIVAIIPALLGSTFFKPSVYVKKGITAVMNAVRIQKNNKNPILFAFENLENMSEGRQISHDPTEANINVYVVTVNGEYLRNAIVPRILYKPYPNPEPSPISSPTKVIPLPDSPETRTQPAKARISAIIFFLSSFS